MGLLHNSWRTGLLGFLVLSAAVTCEQGYHTYIDNLSSRDIVGTTSYSPGKSAFINRIVPAGKTDGDVTENCVTVHCELWVSGASVHNSVNVGCDTSLVAVDASDGKGVDVWTSVYGQLAQKSKYLITVYPDDSPFVLTSISEALPTNFRWATLQDALGQKGGLATTMPHAETAYLVDGWVAGLSTGFASGCSNGADTFLGHIHSLMQGNDSKGTWWGLSSRPPRPGKVWETDYRDDINYKLGVAYTPDDDAEPDVDMVPDGADPNALLENFISAADPQDTLAKRSLTPPAGTGQKKAILAIIELWNIAQLDFGLKQKTLFNLGDYRIDQQSNGPFLKDYVDSNGNHFSVACYNVAVQAGGVVYASINVPAGEYITAGGIRKLLTASLNQGQVLSFVKAAKPRPHTWLAAIATGIVLIGGAVAL